MSWQPSLAWRLPCVILSLCGALVAHAGEAELNVITEDGAVAMRLDLRDGERWCLLWNHSVAGFTVRDCFVWQAPELVLTSSHQPDFAAGLGHFEGRGTVRSDGAGGYLIENIDAVIARGGLRLRVGAAAVDHRIEIRGREHSLSAPLAGRAVTLRASVRQP